MGSPHTTVVQYQAWQARPDAGVLLYRRPFNCPVRQGEQDRGASEFSCSGLSADTMADVRRHMERAKHVEFIRLCSTCNEDLIDKKEFEDKHGYRGEKCTKTPQKQARGTEATGRQYKQLYDLVNSANAVDPAVGRKSSETVPLRSLSDIISTGV